MLPIDRAAAVACAAYTTLIVRVERRFVVDRDLLAGVDVAQRDKEHMVVQDLHERVGTARVIDVMRAVAAAAAVETPAAIHFTNPEHAAMRSASRFCVGDLLAGVLRDLVPLLEGNGGKAAFAVNN